MILLSQAKVIGNPEMMALPTSLVKSIESTEVIYKGYGVRKTVSYFIREYSNCAVGFCLGAFFISGRVING